MKPVLKNCAFRDENVCLCHHFGRQTDWSFVDLHFVIISCIIRKFVLDFSWQIFELWGEEGQGVFSNLEVHKSL